MATTVQRPVTAEVLARLPRDPVERYELVQGELVRMTPVGGEHGKVAARFTARLLAHVEPRRLGEVMVEVGYRLATDPDTVRAPDVSFVASARVPSGALPSGFISGPPDLAVEVTRLVFVVHPRTRTVTAYRADGSARILRSGDNLDGDDVVIEFSLPVDELFSS
jgi:Uma2 family endonuclease